MQKTLKLFSLLLLFAINFNNVCYSKNKQNQALAVNSPLKALVLYFPPPAVMRCLNHSNIPMSFRKAFVYRRAKFPGKEEILQSVTIGIQSNKKKKKFIFTGNISTKSDFIPVKLKGEIAFGEQNQKFNFGLFGLEKLLGLQGKIHIKDKIGNQIIDHETFLKSTKGKIGDLNYTLELTGEDREAGIGPNRSLQYHLTGSGMLGNYNISVSGKDTKKDNYEITEKYGPVEIFTTVRVYD